MFALLRSPQVLRLLLSALTGRLPLGVTPLALVLYGQQFLPPAGVGAVVAAYTLGVAIGQPVLSRLADRWRQPPVLLASLAVSTVGYSVLLSRPGTAAVIGAVLLAGLGAPPLEPCLRVLWRDVVGDEVLHAAYALDVTAQEVIFIAGPLITVAAVGVAGPSAGIVAAAVLQALGTFAFLTAPAVGRWRGERATAKHWAGPLRSPAVRALAVVTLLAGTGVGATVIAVGTSAPQWAGWLLSAQAVGALVGGVVTARTTVRRLWVRLPWLTGAFAVSFLPLALLGGNGPFPVQLMAMAISGLGLPAVLTYLFAATDAAAPLGTATEAFAWIATAFGIGSAIGSAANGAWLAAGYLLAPCAIAVGALVMGLASQRAVRSPVTT